MEEWPCYRKETPLTDLSKKPETLELGVIYRPLKEDGTPMIKPSPFGNTILGFVFLPTLQKPKASCDQCLVPRNGELCELFNCRNRSRYQNGKCCVYGLRVYLPDEDEGYDYYQAESSVDKYSHEIPILTSDHLEAYERELWGIELNAKNYDVDHLWREAELMPFFKNLELYEWNYDHETTLLAEEIEKHNRKEQKRNNND